MTRDLHHFERFVRRLHRRLVVLRVVEHVGLAVLVGCAVSVVLMGILILRHEQALGAVSVIIGVALLAGLAWGISRRPTALTAAMEADRQLKLADLLSTAWSMRANLQSASDSWSNAVIAAADSRSRQLAVSSVILNRFGARAWGGIGLAGALVLTLTFISLDPPASRASSDESASSTTRAANGKHPAVVFDPATSPRRALPGPDREDDRKLGGASIEDAPRAGGNAIGQRPKGLDSSNNTAAAGGGAGSAQTPQKGNDPKIQNTSGGNLAGGKGGETGGGGAAAVDPTAKGVSGRETSDANSAKIAAPWTSENWSADRAAALDAVKNGQIPPKYSDIIRAYFQRESK